MFCFSQLVFRITFNIHFNVIFSHIVNLIFLCYLGVLEVIYEIFHILNYGFEMK